MIAALIDNGSLEAGAHRQLRALAAALSDRTGLNVEAVSWKHSDRIPVHRLDGEPAKTLEPWLRTAVQGGERDFVFVPFFVSPQGAIGSYLWRDLETLQGELGGFRFTFTAGLATNGSLSLIVAARIRETIATDRLTRPAVIVVDHGGPSPASAVLRNQVAAEVAHELGQMAGPILAASLEGGEYAHSRPLFADALATPGFDRGDVVIAPLFLSPGRHAGPRGDLAQIASAAEDRGAGSAGAVPPLACHFTALPGSDPLVPDVLTAALHQTISTFHAAA